VGTQQAIKHNFQHFQVDNQETHVNNQVHEPYKWPVEHFLLAKGDEQHGFQTRSGLIGAVFGPAQLNVPFDKADPFANEYPTCHQQQGKSELLGKLREYFHIYLNDFAALLLCMQSIFSKMHYFGYNVNRGPLILN
jgi:hypothetical protein